MLDLLWNLYLELYAVMDFRFGIEVGPGLQFRLVFLLELELDWGFGSDFLGTDMGLQGRDANA